MDENTLAVTTVSTGVTKATQTQILRITNWEKGKNPTQVKKNQDAQIGHPCHQSQAIESEGN